MKRCTILLLLSQIYLLFGQTGEWTWMHGDNIPNQLGQYGAIGVSNPSNTPGAVYESREWTDNIGNLWLFGGVDNSSLEYSALWKYDVSTNEWTWIKGDNTAEQPGVYGTQGIPAPTNKPGARAWGAATWTDNNGNLWLYGGSGWDALGTQGYLSDLWRYNISTNEWTWMKGSQFANQSATYGTKGVSAPANNPGQRYETSCSWVDISGNLWLFGGGINNASTYFNDLWKYDISSNEWTWISGDNIPNPRLAQGTVIKSKYFHTFFNFVIHEREHSSD